MIYNHETSVLVLYAATANNKLLWLLDNENV